MSVVDHSVSDIKFEITKKRIEIDYGNINIDTRLIKSKFFDEGCYDVDSEYFSQLYFKHTFYKADYLIAVSEGYNDSFNDYLIDILLNSPYMKGPRFVIEFMREIYGKNLIEDYRIDLYEDYRIENLFGLDMIKDIRILMFENFISEEEFTRSLNKIKSYSSEFNDEYTEEHIIIDLISGCYKLGFIQSLNPYINLILKTDIDSSEDYLSSAIFDLMHSYIDSIDDFLNLKRYDDLFTRNSVYLDFSFHFPRILLRLLLKKDSIDTSHELKLIRANNLENIVKNFVNKNSSIIPKVNNKDLDDWLWDYDSERFLEELTKLKKLFEMKNIPISHDQLCIIIMEEFDSQGKSDLAKKILEHNNPKKLEDYLENYLEIYAEEYQSDIGLLKELLVENGFICTYDMLLKELTELKTEKEIQSYEKSLLEYDNKENILTIEDMDEFDGYSFEKFLAILFTKMGYEVEETSLSQDQGADLIIKKFGETSVIQAKRYSDKVTNKAVQEVVASIAHYKAKRGMVITNNNFTKSAVELASSNGIILVGREDLKNYMGNYPIKKDELL